MALDDDEVIAEATTAKCLWYAKLFSSKNKYVITQA